MVAAAPATQQQPTQTTRKLPTGKAMQRLLRQKGIQVDGVVRHRDGTYTAGFTMRRSSRREWTYLYEYEWKQTVIDAARHKAEELHRQGFGVIRYGYNYGGYGTHKLDFSHETPMVTFEPVETRLAHEEWDTEWLLRYAGAHS